MSGQRERGPVRRHGWWIGAAVGAVVAGAVAFGAQGWQEDREAADLAAVDASMLGAGDAPPPADMVRDLLEQDGPLVVHPDLVSGIDADLLAEARRILADADQSPVRRVAYVPRSDGLEVGYTDSGALGQWMHAIGEDGHYVMVFEGGRTQSDALGVEPEYMGSSAKGQPGPALVRVASEMAEWRTDPVDDRRDEVTNSSDYWGGPWGGVFAGLLIAFVTVLPVWGLTYFVLWTRSQRRGRELEGRE